MLGVDDEIGAQLFGQRKFAVVDIDGADLKSHDFGVLNGEVSKTARAGYDDPLASLSLGLLDALVGRYAGADDRRRLLGIEVRRNMGDVVRIGEKIFGKAAVLGVAAELRLGADRLPG